jgi:hypothetical protein
VYPAQPFVRKNAIRFFLKAMQASADRDDCQRQLEAGARAAFEARAGRKLTDTEWAAVRGRLLEFVRILCAWDQPRSIPKEVRLKCYASENRNGTADD